MVQTVGADADEPHKMAGDCRHRTRFPRADACADRAAALEIAGRLQLADIGTPVVATHLAPKVRVRVVVHEKEVIGHWDLRSQRYGATLNNVFGVTTTLDWVSD